MNTVSGSILAGAMAALLTSAIPAADAPQPPKPTPEHRKLGYFVGEWKSEGEVMASALGPGGKTSAHDKCEWFEGGYSVICRGDNQSPAGASKSLSVLSYSVMEKVYTYYSTESNGMVMISIPRGTLKDGTWTFTDASPMQGQVVKSRVSIKEVSPSQYTFLMEFEDEGSKWMTVMKSTATKFK